MPRKDVIDTKNMDSLKDKLRQKNSVVLVHATWCGHCQVFEPEWKKLVSRFAKKNKQGKEIQFFSIESEVYNKIAEADQKFSDRLTKTASSPQMYFPKIMLFTKGKSSIRRKVYDGSRTADDLEKYITDKM